MGSEASERIEPPEPPDCPTRQPTASVSATSPAAASPAGAAFGAPAVEWARFWQGLGCAVGPLEVTPRPGGGYGKRPPPGVTWRGDRGGPWYQPGAPLEEWRPDWRAVGVHLGRSRLVVVDLDSPEGHPAPSGDSGDNPPPIDAQARALARMIGRAALERPAAVWVTASGGLAAAWWVPAGAKPPNGRRVVLPGLTTGNGAPYAVEVRSGENVAAVPCGPLPDGSPGWRVALPLLPPDVAPPIPPALWAALTAPRAAAPAPSPASSTRRRMPPDVAPWGGPLSAKDRKRLEAVAGCYGPRWQWAGDALSIRLQCPACRRAGCSLAIGLSSDGAIWRHCWRGCTLEAIDAAAARPLRLSMIFDRPRLDACAPADPALADALGRALYAVGQMQAAMLEAAADAKERRRLRSTFKADRRAIEAIVQACARAGRLEVRCSEATIGTNGAVGRRIIDRVLARYPGIIVRLQSGKPGEHGTRSTLYRLTPPPADAPAAPLPRLLPGGNAARGMTPTTRGRSWAPAVLDVLRPGMLADDVRAALAVYGPPPCLATIRRVLAGLACDGLAVATPLPSSGGRPPLAYSPAPALADALERRDDDAAAACLPAGRGLRGDSAAAKVTDARRALEAAYDAAHAKADYRPGDGWKAALAGAKAHRAAVKERRRRAAGAPIDRAADVRPTTAPVEPAADAAPLEAAPAPVAGASGGG